MDSCNAKRFVIKLPGRESMITEMTVVQTSISFPVHIVNVLFQM